MLIKLKPCPCCNRRRNLIASKFYRGNILDKYRYCISCRRCEWYGKTKLFLWRAKLSWNKQYRQYRQGG